MNERHQRTLATIAYALIGAIIWLAVVRIVTLMLTLD